MGRFYLLFLGLEILLTVIALISCLSAEEGELRALPRIVWVIVILLFPLVGSIAYFVAGRPNAARAPAGQWRPGSGFPEAERPRQLAPDDDPDFLRKIEQQRRKDDADLLRKWEDDLKRREDDLRKREESPPTDG